MDSIREPQPPVRVRTEPEAAHAAARNQARAERRQNARLQGDFLLETSQQAAERRRENSRRQAEADGNRDWKHSNPPYNVRIHHTTTSSSVDNDTTMRGKTFPHTVTDLRFCDELALNGQHLNNIIFCGGVSHHSVPLTNAPKQIVNAPQFQKAFLERIKASHVVAMSKGFAIMGDKKLVLYGRHAGFNYRLRAAAII